MWKTFAPVLAGLSLVLALPALGAEEDAARIPCGCIIPWPQPPEYFKKTITVEIKGKLDRRDYSHLAEQRLLQDATRGIVADWFITANGQTYQLDFGGNATFQALAEKLNGKTVILTGRLVEPVAILKPCLEIYRPRKFQPVVVVTSLRAAEDDFVHKTETVEISGKLVFSSVPDSMDYKDVDCLVSVNGKGYWLSFVGNKELRTMAHKLRGQTVVVTGTLEHRRTVTVVVVTSLKPAPVPQPLAPRPLAERI
jgi:hypothetical protein